MQQLSLDQDLALREHIVDNEDDFNFCDATDGIGQFEDNLFEDVSFLDESGNVHVIIEDCVVSISTATANKILEGARLPGV